MSRDTFTPAQANEGAFGAPPENAPREVTDPSAPLVQPNVLAEQLAQAHRNEKELTPFNPQPGPNAAQVALAAAAAERVAQKRAGTAPVEGQQYQPAASETDSPSRGVPVPIADPNRKITGGWGDAMGAQYNPLTGLEVAEVARHLMGELSERMARDLRFSIALTYPRAKITVTVKVEGYVSDAVYEVTHGHVHDKTPEDVAQQMAAPTTVEVSSDRKEFDEEGTPENPPDRMRDELGLPKPSKRWVGEGQNRQVVDHDPATGGVLF